MYLPVLLDTEINYTMKEILQNWINFAEEFEKHLGQGESKWSTKIAVLKHKTIERLGLIKLYEEVEKGRKESREGKGTPIDEVIEEIEKT